MNISVHGIFAMCILIPVWLVTEVYTSDKSISRVSAPLKWSWVRVICTELDSSSVVDDRKWNMSHVTTGSQSHLELITFLLDSSIYGEANEFYSYVRSETDQVNNVKIGVDSFCPLVRHH